MRVGDIEGEPEEINDFFDQNNSNLDDFVEKNEKLELTWLITSIVFFVIGLIFLSIGDFNGNNRILVSAINIILIAWVSASVHMRFKNKTASILVGFGLFLAVALASGGVTIQEILNIVVDGSQ